jgi:hypothetical protein
MSAKRKWNFLAGENVTGGGKHHSALVIGFMNDLVVN